MVSLIGFLMWVVGLVGSILIMVTLINAVAPNLMIWYVLSMLGVVVGGVLMKAGN